MTMPGREDEMCCLMREVRAIGPVFEECGEVESAIARMALSALCRNVCHRCVYGGVMDVASSHAPHLQYNCTVPSAETSADWGAAWFRSWPWPCIRAPVDSLELEPSTQRQLHQTHHHHTPPITDNLSIIHLTQLHSSYT
jgi:hypothetical protein